MKEYKLQDHFNLSKAIKINIDDFIDLSKDDIVDDNFILREDMFQAEFDKELCLDIGWYNSEEIKDNGFFIVKLVQDYDWDYPILNLMCRSVKELKYGIRYALKLIDILILNFNSK